jgi:hypothetical protein
MDAQCPICREGDHTPGDCTGPLPFSIVLLQIDEDTSVEVIKQIQRAVQRAASKLSSNDWTN